jgi:signal transduction histidine kinase
MPPLTMPQKIIRLQRIAGSVLFDAPAERVIAQCRFVLCLISLLAVHLVPPQAAQYATAATLILTVYAILSAGLVALTYHLFLTPTTQHVIHIADIIIVSLLLFLTRGLTSPSLALFTFVLLAATCRRWTWQEVVATGITLALVRLAASIVNGGTAASAGDNLNTALIFVGYLIVLSCMLAYISASRERTRNQFERLAHGPASKDCRHTTRTLQEILAHTALVLEAPRILIVWEEREEPYVYWAYWREGHYQQNHEAAGTFGNLVDQSLGNRAFLMADVHSKTVLFSNGQKQKMASAIHSDLVARFSMRGVATAAFGAATCTGRLFVLDRSSWTAEHLPLTQIMAYRTGIRLDSLTIQRQNQVAVAIKERMRLTRDLHNGILQSLTAAALQLSLVDKKSDLSRIAVVMQLLAKEQHRIREFVDEVHPKSKSPSDIVAGDDLQQVVQATGQYWNCTISFSVAPDNATMPQPLADQVSFMLAEAVANAARHGGASKVEVAMEKANGHLAINIRDNGSGFACLDKHEHEEPASIRERVRALGGSLDIANFPNGAELAIRVPVHDQLA